MTKIFAIMMFVGIFVGLGACTSKKPEEGKEPLVAPPAASAPGSTPASAPGPAPATAGSAAPGGSAGSAAPTGEGAVGGGGATHPSLVACASPATLHCDAGQTDGCTGGLTSIHLCVATGAKAGTPCAQGTPLSCPTGQVDACTYTPPYASNHVCVVVPSPTP